MTNTFLHTEKHLSQIPALQLLMNAGYTYISPAEALKQRQEKTSNVLLEGILREQLKKINRISYRGADYLFSEENIQEAVQRLKNVKYDGLLRTNEAVYDLLTLGTTLDQTIEQETRGRSLRYIDWKDWRNNVFHATAEFSVERNRRNDTARPDIVLFVNGIPFAVVECKSPKEELGQAISQCIRNQGDDYIPKLFTYVQLIAVVSKNFARYATVGTKSDFWALWRELRDTDGEVYSCANKPLTLEQKNLLFAEDFERNRSYFDNAEAAGDRSVTLQDSALFSLCRPERLLELAYTYTLFDNGEKKVARYQQYFVVKSALERCRQLDGDGRRRGGIIWHTQGSGKSLTMVMLARNLALCSGIPNPRIVLVTDRDDLDEQLGNTFKHCGLAPVRATSGRNLLDLVFEDKETIVTTLVHKFDKALNARKQADDSADIFVLVDESHRSHFSNMAARMRQMFPRACYLGFTGTPLIKEEKNNFVKFGGLIDPAYSIRQAVEDQAVVPLMYEGRAVEIEQNKEAIDLWFERHTQGLSREQQADLKRKYARASALQNADRVLYMKAFDISEHFRATWQGTGFKAQLVAPSKDAAIKFYRYLNEIGLVTSDVIISAPDAREGYDEVDEKPSDAVQEFWQTMMKRYGKEEEYTKQIIARFKNGDTPEILVVVSKLLTGFDAPRNALLYLCKTLKEHGLLQAIARVNRLYANKDFGFIVDYENVIDELGKALSMYEKLGLEKFDPEDIEGSLISIDSEIAKLPQRHSDLWDIFKTVKNNYDEESYELLLADDETRERFYEAFSAFAKTLSVAFASEKFITQTPETLQVRYKNDLKKFWNLRASVKLRFAESIDYERDFEPKIKKLLDTHIQANEVRQICEPVNIFDSRILGDAKEQKGDFAEKSAASRAETIAYATKKAIVEKMDEDPALFEKFSKMIQKVIDDFRASRISALEYLQRATDVSEQVVSRRHDDAPDALQCSQEAMAFYGVIKSTFAEYLKSDDALRSVSAEAALAIEKIWNSAKKVHFWDDHDAQKNIKNAIDDYLYDDIRANKGVALTTEDMDKIIEQIMCVARAQSR